MISFMIYEDKNRLLEIIYLINYSNFSVKASTNARYYVIALLHYTFIPVKMN